MTGNDGESIGGVARDLPNSGGAIVSSGHQARLLGSFLRPEGDEIDRVGGIFQGVGANNAQDDASIFGVCRIGAPKLDIAIGTGGGHQAA
jgi:hypothetical protein